jgi:hypothetical protein
MSLSAQAPESPQTPTSGPLARLLGELWRDKAGFTGVVLMAGLLFMAAAAAPTASSCAGSTPRSRFRGF